MCMEQAIVPGKLSDDLASGTLNSIYKQASWREIFYEICSSNRVSYRRYETR